MKSLVFDTGPVISLATNNLLWILKPLREQFGGRFYIPKSVEKELITRPLETKRFKFEALQVLKSVRDRTIEIIYDRNVAKRAVQLLELANTCFKARGSWIRIVHYAEIEALAMAVLMKADAMVVDERTTRLLVEDTQRLVRILGKKLHTKILINKKNLRQFKKEAGGIRIMRSVELVTIAYELGLLKDYLFDMPDAKRTLLDSILWGVKLHGCAVSNMEIEKILAFELKKRNK